ncbi:MAG TPA: hypothetical protein VM509_01950, partial [Planctomycetota bacterium]|nr:hypothetical protein [Planctomycetota bacterium]
LLVRREDDLSPIAQCEILYFTGSEEARYKGAFRHDGFDLEVLRREGRHAVTGTDGRVRLACESGDVVVLAVSPTHFGGDRFDFTAEDKQLSTLDCKRISFVRVQVLDGAEHACAGVRVVARRGESDFEFPLSVVTRAPDGAGNLGPLWVEDGSATVAIDGLFQEAVETKFELSAPPVEPIRLTLPAHGSVEVRLRYPDGKPYAGTAIVLLETSRETLRSSGNGQRHVAIGEGRATFAHVGLGLELRAKVRLGEREAEVEAVGAGPRSEKENAVIDVKLDPAHLVVTGRLVDGAGVALRNHQFELHGDVRGTGSARSVVAAIESDDVGRFAFTRENFVEPGERAVFVLFDTSEERPIGCIGELDAVPGTNSVGTLTMQPPELLARGTVIDEGGASAEARNVELVQSDRPFGVGWAIPTRSARGGAFELRGWSNEETLTILAGNRGARVRQPITVVRGATDVVLPLGLAGREKK